MRDPTISPMSTVTATGEKTKVALETTEVAAVAVTCVRSSTLNGLGNVRPACFPPPAEPPVAEPPAEPLVESPAAELLTPAVLRGPPPALGRMSGARNTCEGP